MGDVTGTQRFNDERIGESRNRKRDQRPSSWRRGPPAAVSFSTAAAAALFEQNKNWSLDSRSLSRPRRETKADGPRKREEEEELSKTAPAAPDHRDVTGPHRHVGRVHIGSAGVSPVKHWLLALFTFGRPMNHRRREGRSSADAVQTVKNGVIAGARRRRPPPPPLQQHGDGREMLEHTAESLCANRQTGGRPTARTQSSRRYHDVNTRWPRVRSHAFLTLGSQLTTAVTSREHRPPPPPPLSVAVSLSVGPRLYFGVLFVCFFAVRRAVSRWYRGPTAALADAATTKNAVK